MTVGLPLTKDTLDTRLGQIALNLRQQLDEAFRLNVRLSELTTAELVALGYNEVDKQEVSIMKSAYGDLAHLADVANNRGTQSASNDFFFWARKLLGPYG